jgi:hypothetical protein
VQMSAFDPKRTSPTGANTTSLAVRQSPGPWRLLGNNGVPSYASRWSLIYSRNQQMAYEERINDRSNV